MTPTQNEFEIQFERLGVDEVRARIATNVYLGGLRNLAQAWVDKEIQRRADDSNLEHIRTARSANTAAWIAAIAAIIAAICAVVSIASIFYR
jgi:hypothetical protein